MDKEYSVKDLPSLRRKRTLAYNRIQKTFEFAVKAGDDISFRELFLAYFSEIRQIKATFDETNALVISLDDSKLAEDEKLQEKCDEAYYCVLATHKKLVPDTSIPNNSRSLESVGGKSSNIKLPKITLSQFSGDLKAWLPFIDSYNSIIHNNETLTDTERMHYLTSSLRGDALKVINKFPMTGTYYMKAYEALYARYQNNRDLAYTCWKEIMNSNFKASSPQDFRKVLDMFSENLSILKMLGLPIHEWDFVLTYHIMSRLEPKIRCEFEELNPDVEFPTYQSLESFLNNKCTAQVRDSHFKESPKFTNTKSNEVKSRFPNFRQGLPTTALISAQAYSYKCSFCQEPHSINTCKDFLNKTVQERQNYAMKNNWCFNCLKPSHQLKECKSIFTCQKCKKPHHTLLHIDNNVVAMASSDSYEVETNDEGSNNPDPTDECQEVNVLTNITSNSSVVLLSTASIQVLDSKGNFQNLRALIDSGSQAHFISENSVNRLGFKPSSTTKNIFGLGQSASKVTGSLVCSVGTQNNVQFNIQTYTLPSICGVMPSARLDKGSWSHIQNLKLADPDCNIPGPIDVLLGAEVFTNIMLPGVIKGGENQPSAMNSIFGWVLLGKTLCGGKNDSSRMQNHLCSFLSISSHDNHKLHQDIQLLWELDSVPHAATATPDDILCEKKYQAGTTRTIEGRYIVPLPFKSEEPPEFPGSRQLALRRFHLLERRLLKDPALYQAYKDFLIDYIDCGHMSRVPVEEVGTGKHYIPHHCVLRPDSETTKTRVVFDASARAANGKSLNETLLTGGKLQADVSTILLRFRLHTIVFIADMKQMYRQILIRTEDQEYLRILFRFNPNEPINEYRLNTVTYGTSAAPFQACRTIKQLVADEGEPYPLASRVLTSELYVDDVTSGSPNLAQARRTKSELNELLLKGGFELRKWASNSPELLEDVPTEHRLSGTSSLDNSRIFKILGLRWKADSFLFDVSPSQKPCTKRNILSEVARVFDPLGFLSPVTFLAKGILQKLWLLGIDWDATPPEEFAQMWQEYNEDFHLLQQIDIKRRITVDDAKSYQLHGFADSSEAGYGATVYLRAVNANDDISTSLVCAKARVAPLKKQTIPRLELCAAVLLANLMKVVIDTYTQDIAIERTFAWTDSTIVLAWLDSHCSRWKTFVANRVAHIQERLPDTPWRHVPTDQNPADIASRGSLPKLLVGNKLWWAGPEWLKEPDSEWPKSPSQERFQGLENVQAEERVFLATQTPCVVTGLLERHSSLRKVINVLSYCMRFIKHCQHSDQRNAHSLVLSIQERNEALTVVVKTTQSEAFSHEINNLKHNKLMSKPFRKLNLFLDEHGVLRVGGCLSRSGLDYEHKFPALLPRKHRLTELVIKSTHEQHCHPGLNTTHYLILQRFWIISAKRAIRSYLSQCVQCYRTYPKPTEPFMSDLPSTRLKAVKPFSIVGVDYGGPFGIKLGKHRGAKSGKAYLCLFVCFATKAVHLEVASDLSTEAFIAALRRFVARRGRCNIIHSDCGTNFIGARNQLADLMRNAAERDQIQFRCNPPSAPHFGGVWEIQIKAAKTLLYRTIGSQVLSFEELTTLFAQIESTLNSRPLCSLSSDPNDFNVLTPGHFLTLEPLTSVPDVDLTNVKLYRLDRWQLLQQLHQSFWRRWHLEYLNSLTQRAKWTKHSRPLKVNSVVIIKENDSFPLHWPLARVVELHTSPDGIVRQATVKLSRGSLMKRPLVKLCPLPDKCD